MNSDSVVPDAMEPEPSPAVKALREEVALVQGIFYSLGEMPVRSKEAEKAAAMLRYVDKLAQAKIQELDSLIATEILQRPVKVENGTKISLAEAKH